MKTKMAGARIDAALWDRFAANAKATGKSVAEALEEALRAALTPVKRKAFTTGAPGSGSQIQLKAIRLKGGGFNPRMGNEAPVTAASPAPRSQEEIRPSHPPDTAPCRSRRSAVPIRKSPATA